MLLTTTPASTGRASAVKITRARRYASIASAYRPSLRSARPALLYAFASARGLPRRRAISGTPSSTSSASCGRCARLHAPARMNRSTTSTDGSPSRRAAVSPQWLTASASSTSTVYSK